MSLSSVLIAAALPVLQIGWAEADITPKEPVLLRGQLFARLSEGVESPLKATALYMQKGDTSVAFVSCDFVAIPDELRKTVREQLNRPDLHLILNATHTHTAPSPGTHPNDVGVKLPAQEPADYTEYASTQISNAIRQAMNARKPGSVAFGIDEAVIGRNRRWVNHEGKATMYRLNDETKDTFRHIEGYEDHSLNLLATYDESGKLSGLIVNSAIPAQQNEIDFKVSADFWHEARTEIRKRHGNSIFILPQCSTGGDQAPRNIWGKKAQDRMLELRKRAAREEIAIRIADAVDRILPVIEPTKDSTPVLRHQQVKIELPAIQVKESDLEGAKENVTKFRQQYQKLLAELPPEAEREGRWYIPVTRAYMNSKFHERTLERFEAQTSVYPLEMDLVQLGEIAFATMPFEVYLDYGMQIKVRSPFIQTFLIQLTGNGTYVSSARAEAGKGYGSTPSSNMIDSKAGQIMTEALVQGLHGIASETNSTGVTVAP